MSATYGPAWAKREAIRREQRRRGVVPVPPPAVLDRIVAEHEAAARLGRPGHDELCEAEWPIASSTGTPCYCSERADALERIARRLDAASDLPLTFDQSVTDQEGESR